MPVNPAELKFFKFLAQQAEGQAVKPLAEMAVEEFCQSDEAFVKYAGEEAHLPKSESFALARDGYHIPLTIFNAHLQEGPVLLVYPACGYILSVHDINKIMYSRLAHFAGIKVIYVEFRLATQAPMPTPIDDGYDAALYIYEHAQQFAIDPNKIMVGGLSSGGHCAASISILARDNHSIPILHQYLINPAVDFTRSETAYAEFEKEDKILTREVILKTYDCYGLSFEERKKPIYAPLFAEAKGLPPTTIVVGEYDCIRGDSEAYYLTLKAAGVHVKKILLEGQTHCTMYSRAMMSDGPDPAEVIAQEILKDLR